MSSGGADFLDVLINNNKFTNALAELFAHYQHYFVQISKLAHEHNPKSLHISNEVAAMLHHVIRAVRIVEEADAGNMTSSIDAAQSEIIKAQNTHLLRATYDSYKIVLNSILEHAIDLDESVNLFEVCKKYFSIDKSDPPEMVQFYDLLSKVQKLYSEAKIQEAKGLSLEVVVSHYNRAFMEALDLKKLTDKFMKNDSIHKKSTKKFKQNQLQKNRDSKITIIQNFIDFFTN